MGSFLAYTVETLDDRRHGAHHLADFARLTPAVNAARHALEDARVQLAVVKNRDGVLVYAADRRKEWEGGDSASNDFALL